MGRKRTIERHLNPGSFPIPVWHEVGVNVRALILESCRNDCTPPSPTHQIWYLLYSPTRLWKKSNKYYYYYYFFNHFLTYRLWLQPIITLIIDQFADHFLHWLINCLAYPKSKMKASHVLLCQVNHLRSKCSQFTKI